MRRLTFAIALAGLLACPEPEDVGTCWDCQAGVSWPYPEVACVGPSVCWSPPGATSCCCKEPERGLCCICHVPDGPLSFCGDPLPGNEPDCDKLDLDLEGAGWSEWHSECRPDNPEGCLNICE